MTALLRTWLAGGTACVVLALAASCSDARVEFKFRTGPHVAEPMQSSVLVVWVSCEPGVGAVEFGTTESLGRQVTDAAPTDEHALRLQDLEPGSTYHYQTRLDGEVASAGHVVSTAPADPGAPVRFAAFGDSGKANDAQRAVAASVKRSDVDLVLITGDVVYEDGARSEIDDAYFTPYRDLIDHIPFFPALGNHDVRTGNGQPLLDTLHLPRNDAEGTERYYSFDWGPAHFVALDSTSPTGPGSPQHDWLQEDLTASSSRWVFVYFHHPPYSSSRHGSSVELQEDLVPVFDGHDVDIVFSGHDHDYERTFPLRDGRATDTDQEPDYTDPQGTVYVVTGGGGAPLYGNGQSDFTAFSRSVHHHVVVEIEGERLGLSAVNPDGEIVDRMTITKTP